MRATRLSAATKDRQFSLQLLADGSHLDFFAVEVLIHFRCTKLSNSPINFASCFLRGLLEEGECWCYFSDSLKYFVHEEFRDTKFEDRVFNLPFYLLLLSSCNPFTPLSKIGFPLSCLLLAL